jgi:hypothetical protein
MIVSPPRKRVVFDCNIFIQAIGFDSGHSAVTNRRRRLTHRLRVIPPDVLLSELRGIS